MRAGTFVMTIRRLFILLLGGYVWVLPILPHEGVAGIGEWKNYTDMKNVRSVASDGRSIWAGTEGGVFRFHTLDSTYQKFVNSDGLSTNDVTAIALDSEGRVWIGQQSGNIDVYDPRTRAWRYITDIALSAKVNRVVNGFFQQGDNLYIAVGFGVTVFSLSKFEFSDTYTGFDLSVTQPNARAVRLYNNRVFIASSAGIIASKSGSSNLADPKSWVIESPITTANAFTEFNGSLYASTGSGLLIYQSNTWNIAAGISGNVRIVAAFDTAVVFSEGAALRSLNAANGISTLSSAIPAAVTSGTFTNNRKIFLGFTTKGIGGMNGSSQWEVFYPNGPNSNLFYQMVVDQNGELWTASGGHTGGQGFYRFDGSVWTNFTTANTPLLLVNDCYQIAVGPNNSKWISTWGEGLILVNANGVPVRRFDYDYPGFVGVIRGGTNNVPSYCVPSRAAVDRSGNVWLVGVFSQDRNKVLWKMKPDSTWEYYSGSPFSSDYAFMYSIVFDQNNTKWFSNALISRVESQSIVYHNDERAIGGTVNGWGILTESNGVTNQRVQSIVVDLVGDIWMGTGIGITVINEPANPAQRISKVYDLSVRDLFINCIAVDPLNNKWIGTSRGVFVLSPDGTQSLGHYSVENTGGKLVDNNINTIAIDGKKGIVYIGTEKGLSSLEIAATAPKNTFSSIDLSPNPVYLSTHSSVEISGLVDESLIKVLALNGTLINQFPAQGGGRAFWNCRDGEGRMVSSGVYLIVAYNRAGDQVATSKVAIIQK